MLKFYMEYRKRYGKVFCEKDVRENMNKDDNCEEVRL